MPNAQFASNVGSPNRFSNMSEWSAQPQHPRYPYPFPAQQFLPTSYSGQSMLPSSYSGQNDMGLMPSAPGIRDQPVSLLDKFWSPDAFASSNFDPVSRAMLSPSHQTSRQPQQQQLQLAQITNLQPQQQQPQFLSAHFTQLPHSIPTSQPAFDTLGSAKPFMTEAPSFDQLRRTASVRSSHNSDSAVAAYLREQERMSMLSPSSNKYPIVLNTSIPSDPRAPSITASTHTISYSHVPSYPTAQGVMASQGDLASFAKMFGARPSPTHEWLTDSSAPPGIAVTHGSFITSLDTKVPLPPSPVTASSASLASPATANTSISSALDGYELHSGPVAVRSASGASGTPLSSPSTSSPNVSPKHSGAVAGGKRSREESHQSLSQSEHESDPRHLLFPQKPLSLSSLSSRSNPVSPSVSCSSVARVPTPSGALTQSFTTISLSSVAPSDASSDPSSYLFQRPSPSIGLSVSSSTASLPECVSVSSLIFNRANMGSSPQLPTSLDDTPSEGNTSPSKKIKSGPAPSPSPSPSSLSLPSSSSFTSSGVPSLTWPIQSPASRQSPQSVGGSSAYPFNAVSANRSSKKGGKAEPKGPKNPRSAYVFFVADQRKKLARTEMLANSTFQEVASALGARWRALGPEDRRPFEEMARRDKERYQNEKAQSYDDM